MTVFSISTKGEIQEATVELPWQNGIVRSGRQPVVDDVLSGEAVLPRRRLVPREDTRDRKIGGGTGALLRRRRLRRQLLLVLLLIVARLDHRETRDILAAVQDPVAVRLRRIVPAARLRTRDHINFDVAYRRTHFYKVYLRRSLVTSRSHQTLHTT